MPGTGIEPVHPRGARDFKSLASTNSATQACPILGGFSGCVKQAGSTSSTTPSNFQFPVFHQNDTVNCDGCLCHIAIPMNQARRLPAKVRYPSVPFANYRLSSSTLANRSTGESEPWRRSVLLCHLPDLFSDCRFDRVSNRPFITSNGHCALPCYCLHFLDFRWLDYRFDFFHVVSLSLCLFRRPAPATRLAGPGGTNPCERPIRSIAPAPSCGPV